MNSAMNSWNENDADEGNDDADAAEENDDGDDGEGACWDVEGVME